MEFNSDERAAALFHAAIDALNRAGIFPDWTKDERTTGAIYDLHNALGRIISMKVYEEERDANEVDYENSTDGWRDYPD